MYEVLLCDFKKILLKNQTELHSWDVHMFQVLVLLAILIYSLIYKKKYFLNYIFLLRFFFLDKSNCIKSTQNYTHCIQGTKAKKRGGDILYLWGSNNCQSNESIYKDGNIRQWTHTLFSCNFNLLTFKIWYLSLASNNKQKTYGHPKKYNIYTYI